ncbi:twin-arginine translocation signal domain-containing protein [Pedobacter riviphilus]
MTSEPMNQTRRKFLQNTAVVTAASMLAPIQNINAIPLRI